MVSARAAAARATRTAHLDEVLCFCHGIEMASGHPLATEGCSAKVPVGTYPSRSRNAPSHPRPSTLALDIYTELAKTAPSAEARAHYRGRAAIAQSADREHQAQEARSSEKQREIRLRNIAASA